MNRRLVATVAVVVLVLLVGATLAIPGDDDERAAPDEPETTTTLPFDPEPGVVYAFRTEFVPNLAVEVKVGDTLVFENRDEVAHTFTSDEGLFDSGPIERDRPYGYAYTTPGTYGFHCEIHPTMRGQVVVTDL